MGENLTQNYLQELFEFKIRFITLIKTEKIV